MILALVYPIVLGLDRIVTVQSGVYRCRSEATG
jgi:hypothetical protein